MFRFNIEDKSIVKEHSFNSLLEAQAELERIKNGKPDCLWDSVDTQIKMAHSFIEKYKNNNNGDFNYYPLNRLSFIFAISDLIEGGYEYKKADGSKVTLPPTKKNVTRRERRRRQQTRRYLVDLLNNPLLPQKSSDIIEMLTCAFDTIAMDVGTKETTAKNTFINKSKIIVDALKCLVEFVDAYPGIGGIISLAENSWQTTLQRNIKNSEGSGTIVLGTHYPWIPLPDLKILLDDAWEISPYLYNCLILSLTTIMRPEECLRLVSNPFAYIVDHAFLNYQGGELTFKTIKKVPLSALSNPALSIVARLIVFHDQVAWLPKYFVKTDQKSCRVRHKELEPYTFRSIRTTAATMLLYCGNVQNNSLKTMRDLQMRMAHTTPGMRP